MLKLNLVSELAIIFKAFCEDSHFPKNPEVLGSEYLDFSHQGFWVNIRKILGDERMPKVGAHSDILALFSPNLLCLILQLET